MGLVCLTFFLVTRKLINTHRNIDGMFLLVNCSEFYRRKYFISIYRENYRGEKELKQSQKVQLHVIYTNKFTVIFNSIGKLIGKLFTSP